MRALHALHHYTTGKRRHVLASVPVEGLTHNVERLLRSYRTPPADVWWAHEKAVEDFIAHHGIHPIEHHMRTGEPIPQPGPLPARVRAEVARELRAAQRKDRQAPKIADARRRAMERTMNRRHRSQGKALRALNKPTIDDEDFTRLVHGLYEIFQRPTFRN